MVEGNEKIEAESVMEYTDKLYDTVLADRRIKYVHGKMKSVEKDEILKSFSEGNIDILVSNGNRGRHKCSQCNDNACGKCGKIRPCTASSA